MTGAIDELRGSRKKILEPFTNEKSRAFPQQKGNPEKMSNKKTEQTTLISENWLFESDLFSDVLGPFSGSVTARMLASTSTSTPGPQEITGKYCGPFDLFGSSLSKSGNWLFVGAPLQDLAGEDSGAVHIYRLEGQRWHHEDILLPEANNPCQWFGSALASNGNLLAVSAPSSGFLSDHCGEVIIFW